MINVINVSLNVNTYPYNSGFFFILSNTASAANLSLLSTERFMAIKFPIKHRTCLRDIHINLGIIVVWTASTMIATSKWYSEVIILSNGAYHLQFRLYFTSTLALSTIQNSFSIRFMSKLIIQDKHMELLLLYCSLSFPTSTI